MGGKAKAKTDWTVIENEYITGDETITYKSLSEKYGVSEDAVQKRGWRGGWTGKRAEFRQNVSENVRKKVQKKVEEFELESLEAVRNRQLILFKTIQVKVVKRLTDETQPLEPAIGHAISAANAEMRIYETIFGIERQPDAVVEHNIKLLLPEELDEL